MQAPKNKGIVLPAPAEVFGSGRAGRLVLSRPSADTCDGGSRSLAHLRKTTAIVGRNPPDPFLPSIGRMKGAPMEERPGKGISRRSMMKRLGAGAAIAWSAPVLTSLRTPAFAQPYVCESGCPRCQFGPPCLTCACVGVPVECFCSGVGTCRTDMPICAADSDCDQYCDGPGGRCAECVFTPECVETSCWCPCSRNAQPKAGRKVRVIRPTR